MHPARTTPQARNHAVRQRRDGRGGKWRTFAAGGAPRGAPRVPRRLHHARLPVRARSRRAVAAAPRGHEPSPARAPADSSPTLGDPHAACRDHSRTPAAVHPGLEARPTSAALRTQAHGQLHHARQPVSARSRRAAAAAPRGHESSPARAPADSSCTLGDPHAACRDHSPEHDPNPDPPAPARRGPARPPPETRNGADPKADPVEECGGSPADSPSSTDSDRCACPSARSSGP
jgi:hypothetical protein